MGNTFSIKVDYDKNVCECICKKVCRNSKLYAAIGEGNYDGVLNFDSLMDYEPKENGQAKLTMKLLRFRGLHTTKEILAKIDANGYRPAELFELLAFGAKHPELQRKFTIVALGTSASFAHGFIHFPCLTGDSGVRRLETAFVNDERENYRLQDSDSTDRFLVVKKSLPKNN